MKHDLFEFSCEGMTWPQKAWRIAFLLLCIGMLMYDMFIWRP